MDYRVLFSLIRLVGGVLTGAAAVFHATQQTKKKKRS